MVDRPVRWGFNGVGRSLDWGNAPKVARAEITSAYDVDVRQIAMSKAAFCNEDRRTITKRPADDAWDLLEGEWAFKVRGAGNAVLTCLNGLEAPIVEVYPNDRGLVRDILESMIQPIGVVREDVRADKDKVQVTLRTGGSCPAGSPGYYNVPGQEHAHIFTGGAVVVGVPDLADPILFGTRASGMPENKITLVCRGADKRSVARRIQNVLGNIVYSPEKFARALKDHPRISNAWIKIAMRIVHSYKVSALMTLDLLLKADVLRVSPAAVELLANDRVTPLPNEETVARLAELLGVLDRRRVFGSLTAAQSRKWRELDFFVSQRIIPVPHPDSGAYNLANEFGFARDPNTGVWSSKARIDQSGELSREPIGRLLEQQYTHFSYVLESYTEAMWEELRLTMGTAFTTPSQASTGIFDMFIIPHGGLSTIH